MIDLQPRKGAEGGTLNPHTRVIGYVLTGTDSYSMANSIAVANTPPAAATGLGVLFRQNVRTTKRGYNLWHVDVEYGRVNKEAGEFTWSWDGYGQPLHITHSLETVASYGTSPPDYKGAIGVRGDQIDGLDIDVTASRFTIEFTHPSGFFSFAHAAAIDDVRGLVSNNYFFGFAPGEVRFLRFRGMDGTNIPAQVFYEFERQKNAVNIPVGDITVAEKQGMDYAWIRYKDAVDSGVAVKQPEHVYVERVFGRTDLAAALGFGA